MEHTSGMGGGNWEILQAYRGIELLNKRVQDSIGAIVTCITMGLSWLSTHAAEVNIRPASPLVLTQCAPDVSLPAIAIANPQIYEFLAGKITSQDTNKTLYARLKKRITELMYQASDEYSKFVVEGFYRTQRWFPPSEVFDTHVELLHVRMNEFVTLYKKLEGFRISGVSNMNDILIEDYWNKDLDTPINTREHEAMLNRDRKVLNFTLRDLHEAISSGKIQYPADTEIDYN